jgi:hypothetical protein
MRFGLLNQKEGKNEKGLKKKGLEGGDADEGKIQHCSDPFGPGSNDHTFSCYSYDDSEKIGGGVVNKNSGEDTWDG